MARISFTPHRGKDIFEVDGGRLSEAELCELWDEAEAATALARPTSLRVLLVLNAPLTRRLASELERHMVEHSEKVLATAVVGTAFWRTVMAAVRARGRQNIELFQEREAALDWLASR